MARSRSPTRLSDASAFGKYPLRHYIPLWMLAVVNFVLIMVYVVGGFQKHLGDHRQLNDTTVYGDLDVTGTLTHRVPITSITAATRTIRADESGTHFSLNVASGTTVTLPTCAAGLVYYFSVGTTFTTAGLINTAATDELYVGGLTLNDPATATDMNFFSADVTNDDTIDLGSAGQGWLQGGQFKLVGLSATRWHVEGSLVGDGTLATPFE